MNTGILPNPARPAGETRFDAVLSVVRRWAQKRAQPTVSPGDDEMFGDLVELDARLLCDIGAPAAIQARAQAKREVQRQRDDDLRTGVDAGGAWRHW